MASSSSSSYCHPCERYFSSVRALNDHLANSSTHNYCFDCSRDFMDADALLNHLANSSRHNYCIDCSREFRDPNALRYHLASSIHQPRNIKCPRCASTFVTASALAKHIETSQCINVSNKQIVQAVKKWERSSGNQNLFTIPRIGWHDTDTRSAIRVRYEATEASFDGEMYVCCICSKGFRSLNSLNQHLNSMVHEADEFHCRKCGRRFKVLSALIAHAESEVCGATNAERIKKLAIDAQRHITFALKD